MMAMGDLLALTPQGFIDFLRDNNIRRCYFIYDSEKKKINASHPVLEPLARFFETDGRDFSKHEGVFLQIANPYDILQGAFIHKTVRGQAAGGTRFWEYDTLEDYLRDGLRLSKGMTRKNALAGLWWGGGKGVMAQNPKVDATNSTVRKAVFNEFGNLVTSLWGCYITAEDVGTNTADIGHIFGRTRFVISIPQAVGGSGNPSIATARGVIKGMEAAVRFEDQSMSLVGKRVAVQGLGNVGGPLVNQLIEQKVGSIVACDINPGCVAEYNDRWRNKGFKGRVVTKDDLSILEEECDILVPCATGGILNPQTVSKIKAKIICGAANNQLEDPPRDDQLVFDKGILYVPDFLVNRMGIVNCANEMFGYVFNDPLIERHLGEDWGYGIYQTTLKVLKMSKELRKPPGEIAVDLADELSNEPHPIFNHRGRLIIQSLIKNLWEKSR